MFCVNIGTLTSDKPVQKPAKPKIDPTAVPRGIPGVNLKQQLTRADGRPADSDLPSLEEERQKQDDSIQRFIDTHVQRHRDWNRGYCDATWRPITPPLESSSKSSFMAAAPRYNPLPTPPPSVDSHESNGEARDSPLPLLDDENGIKVEHTSAPLDVSGERPAFSYRRRYARGGRLLIDRRGLKRKLSDIKESGTTQAFDRWDFDHESDEDGEIVRIDPFENFRMRIRISLQSPTASRDAQEIARLRRSIAEAGGVNGNPTAADKVHPTLPKGNHALQVNGS